MQQFAQLGFPEMYEQALVPTLFRPWAEDILSRIDVGPGDTVLDVACGTGIVARLARERIGDGRVVGVDMNPGMIDVARARAPNVEWRVGDAASLPVDDGDSFSVVLCQQGVQFFADRTAALHEFRRVLTRGGRLAMSAWRADEELPVLHSLRVIAERHVGRIADRRHSFTDEDEFRRLVADARFSDVEVAPVTRTMRFADGATFVSLNAMAMVGMSERGAALGPGERAAVINAIVADCRDLIAAHTDANGFAYELSANIVTATG